MYEYKKLPWDMEDTIENMQDMKEMFKQQLHKINFEGKGIEDGKELEFDFNRAIEALEKQVPKKHINGLCPECKEILSIQSYHGEIIANRICYYCPTCGQRIDWEE